MTHANLPISFWGMRCLQRLTSLTVCLVRVYPLPHMSYGMVESPLWNIYAHGVRSAMYITPTHKHGKLGARATKLVFIRYPEHSKGYVMYGEHRNGGLTEVDSRNVEFLEDEFPSIGEIKQDMTLYELPPNDRLSLSEGEDLNTLCVTEDSTPPLFGRDDELLVA